MKTNRNLTIGNIFNGFDSCNFDANDVAVFIKQDFLVILAGDCPIFAVPDFVVFFYRLYPKKK
jgi:hypothetical protein